MLLSVSQFSAVSVSVAHSPRAAVEALVLACPVLSISAADAVDSCNASLSASGLPSLDVVAIHWGC